MYTVIDKLEECTHEFTNWDKEGFFRNEQLTIKEESTRCLTGRKKSNHKKQEQGHCLKPLSKKGVLSGLASVPSAN